jgi:hypothetical protein
LVTLINSARGRLRYGTSGCTSEKLAVATQLSGGGEEPRVEDSFTETDQISLSSPSHISSTPATTKPRAFLGSLHHRKETLIPKFAEVNTAALQKVKAGLEALQETSTRVAPSIVTIFSILWTSEKGISFLPLYALSLLGASCGFYLFLYFITVGYAMGVTLPLVAALFMYKVSGSYS